MFDDNVIVAPDFQAPSFHGVRIGRRSNRELQRLDFAILTEMNNRVRVGIDELGVAVGDAQYYAIDNKAQIAGATDHLVGQYRHVFFNLQAIGAVGTDTLALVFVADAEVGFCQQSRRYTEDLSFAGGGAGVAGNSRQIDLEHSLPRFNRREVIAAMRVGQCIDTTVQHHHSAGDAFFTRVQPAIAVLVVKDLANHCAEIENRIGRDLEFGAGCLRDRTGIAHVHRNRSIRVTSDVGASADDHRIAQSVIATLTGIGNTVAIGVDER